MTTALWHLNGVCQTLAMALAMALDEHYSKSLFHCQCGNIQQSQGSAQQPSTLPPPFNPWLSNLLSNKVEITIEVIQRNI
jgi:hypothetical protein